jgi:hypothetical protein
MMVIQIVMIMMMMVGGGGGDGDHVNNDGVEWSNIASCNTYTSQKST